MNFVANVQALVDRSFDGKVNRASRAWGIPQRTLHSVVKEERVPGLNTAEEIARASGHELWQLLQKEFDPAKPPRLVPMTPAQWAFFKRAEDLVQSTIEESAGRATHE